MMWMKMGNSDADLPSIGEMCLGGLFQFLLLLPGQEVEVNYLVFEDFDHDELEVGELLEFLDQVVQNLETRGEPIIRIAVTVLRH